MKNNIRIYDNVASELLWGNADALHESELSVVIPTYKRANLLRHTLESVLQQARALKIRVLIVDNNPERDDETERLVKETCGRDDVCYYKNKENIGPCGNWNRMLELCPTRWCMMLHDDDVLFPDRMSFLLDMVREHPTAAVISFAKVDFRGEGGYDGEEIPLARTAKSMRLELGQCLASNPVHVVGLLLRRDVILSHGGFDNSYYPSIDYECWLRLLIAGEAVVLSQAIIGAYRWFDNDTLRPETVKNMHKIDLLLRQHYANQARMHPMMQYYLERKSLRHAKKAFAKAGIGRNEYVAWQKQFVLLKLPWYLRVKFLWASFSIRKLLKIRWECNQN